MKVFRLTAKRALVIAIAMLLAMTVLDPATATHQPADKVTAAGSGLEAFSVASPTDEVGANTDTRPILTGTLRTSTPTDLVLSVALECALWTATSTSSNETDEVDSSETEAQVKVWVTIDGGDDPTAGIVPVAADDTMEPGKVVFHRSRFLWTPDKGSENRAQEVVQWQQGEQLCPNATRPSRRPGGRPARRPTW